MNHRDKGRRARAAVAGLAQPLAALDWPALAAHLRAGLDPRAVFLAEADARRLFLWLPAAMGVGVLLFFAADGVPSPWPAGALAAICAAAAFRLRARLGPFVLFWALAALFAGFGAAAWRARAVEAPVLARPAQARLAGFVETVDAGPAGGRLVLRLTSFFAAGVADGPHRVRVTFRGSPPRAGDHVSGQARLTPPPQPAFPGGYDFARDAWFLELGAVGRWTGGFQLSAPPAAPPWRLRLSMAVDNARVDLTNRIQRFIGGQAGALAAALVTGKRGLLDAPTNDALRASGLYHIVSISGLHMVLAAGVFFWLSRVLLALVPGFAERRPIRKWAAVAAMVGATAYCVFSGSEVATERSLIMTLVMLGAILFDRPALSMRNVAIAALIVTAREPETILGPSFQMSFAAVAGMIAAAEWWKARRPAPPEERNDTFLSRGLRRLAVASVASVAMTLVASLATGPFAAYHFQRFNPYGLIGNALAIPFVSLIVMPSAVAGALLLPFGLDGVVWQLMGAGSARVLDVAAWVARMDGAVRGVRAFDSAALLWMAAGFLPLILLRNRLRLLGLVPLAIGVLLAAQAKPVDMFVDREGRLAAVRSAGGELAILGRSRGEFIVDRWLAADGDTRTGVARKPRAATRCDRSGCVTYLPDGRAVSLVLLEDAFEEDCRRAAFVVSPLRAPPWCANDARVIDQELLSRTGSLAVRLSGADAAYTRARPEENWKPWYGRTRGTVTLAASGGAEQIHREEPGSAAPEDHGELILP
jgi:competence protein ComEC